SFLLSSSYCSSPPLTLHSFPTRRSSDLVTFQFGEQADETELDFAGRRGTHRDQREPLLVRHRLVGRGEARIAQRRGGAGHDRPRSEEHTSELQSLRHLVCRLLLEKKKHT